MNPNKEKSVIEVTWEEFRRIGLLWFVNMVLHLFGYSIVVDVKDDGTIVKAYPARTIFRGFDTKQNDDGYKNVTRYLKEEIDTLLSECDD